MRMPLVIAAVLPLLVGATASVAKPKPPAELVTARASFAAAVAANDEKAAAALTSFPLKVTAYKQRPTLARARFHQLFGDYRQMADCIKTGPLESEKAGWVVDCNGNLLRFALRKGRWLHTEYENINE